MTLIQSVSTQVCIPCSTATATATAVAALQELQLTTRAPETHQSNKTNVAFNVVPTVEPRVALTLDARLRLSDDAPTKIQKRKRGGTKSVQKKGQDKQN